MFSAGGLMIYYPAGIAEFAHYAGPVVWDVEVIFSLVKQTRESKVVIYYCHGRTLTVGSGEFHLSHWNSLNSRWGILSDNEASGLTDDQTRKHHYELGD